MRRNSFVQAALTGRIGVRLTGGGAAGFVGAYDAIPSITAAYGMRRLLTSYTGNILRLRRASDNAELDFGYDSNGDLDTAAVNAWLTATTGYVVTWYDQSGNGYNATQATAASQPLYVASGQNSKPVARFDGTDDNLVASVAVPDYPVSIFSVGRRTGGVSLQSLLNITSGGNNYLLQQFATANANAVARNTTAYTATATANWATYNINTARFVSATNRISRVNGSNGTAETTSVTFPSVSKMYIGRLRDSDMADMLTGEIAELTVASVDWTDAQCAAAEAAANAYWSVY